MQTLDGETVTGDQLAVDVIASGEGHVLATLGLIAHIGEADTVDREPFEAGDFLGRVLLAHALAPFDSGLVVTPTGGVATAGRPKGYLQTVLMPLGELARWAYEHDCLIGWAAS